MKKKKMRRVFLDNWNLKKKIEKQKKESVKQLEFIEEKFDNSSNLKKKSKDVILVEEIQMEKLIEMIHCCENPLTWKKERNNFNFELNGICSVCQKKFHWINSSSFANGRSVLFSLILSAAYLVGIPIGPFIHFWELLSNQWPRSSQISFEKTKHSKLSYMLQ